MKSRPRRGSNGGAEKTGAGPSRPGRPNAGRQQEPPARKPKAGAQAAEHRSVLGIIRDIRAGTLSGRALAPADRQRCVEHLLLEGLSNPEAAELLGVCERTIIRDRQAVREANALHAIPSMLPEVAGHLVRLAEALTAKMHKIARDSAAPHAVRLEALKAIAGEQRALITVLQSLGYLPTAPQSWRGELTSDLALRPPTFEDLRAETGDILRLAREHAPAEKELSRELRELEGATERLEIEQRLATAKRRLARPDEGPAG